MHFPGPATERAMYHRGMHHPVTYPPVAELVVGVELRADVAEAVADAAPREVVQLRLEVARQVERHRVAELRGACQVEGVVQQVAAIHRLEHLSIKRVEGWLEKVISMIGYS